MSTQTAEMTRIFVVDDHPIVRQGYEQLIGNQPDLVVCGYAESEQEALQRLEQAAPSVVIVDISLKGGNGIDLIHAIRLIYPTPKVLVISAHDENIYAERALQAGSLGYLNKQEATERLIDAIRKIEAGDVYVSEQIERKLLQHRVGKRKNQTSHTPIDSLTDRELQVFELIGRGCATKQIAEFLYLSPKTVERYKENIKAKLAIANATALTQRATQWVLESI